MVYISADDNAVLLHVKREGAASALSSCTEECFYATHLL